jgi:hypothetical protein
LPLPFGGEAANLLGDVPPTVGQVSGNESDGYSARATWVRGLAETGQGRTPEAARRAALLALACTVTDAKRGLIATLGARLSLPTFVALQRIAGKPGFGGLSGKYEERGDRWTACICLDTPGERYGASRTARPGLMRVTTRPKRFFRVCRRIGQRK